MPKLVKYKAAWCAPCKAMSAFDERIAAECGVAMEVIDIEEQRHLVPPEVASVPNLRMVADDGTVLSEHSGPMPPAKLRAFIEAARD